jgi:hypothetical protein
MFGSFSRGLFRESDWLSGWSGLGSRKLGYEVLDFVRPRHQLPTVSTHVSANFPVHFFHSFANPIVGQKFVE